MKTAYLVFAAFIFSAATGWSETLSLKECLEKAAAANPSLKVSAYDEKVAAENVAIVRSGFLPRIDLQGGYTAQLEPQSIKFATGSFATQDADYPFLNLSLDQTLYDFGRTEARVQRAALVRDATAQDYTGREKDLFLQVVEAYYGTLESRKVLQTAVEDTEMRKEHLRVAQNLYEQGVVTRNDLLQAEVKLADSKQRQLDAANRVENSWLQLNFLMGAPAPFRADLEELPDSADTAQAEGTPEEAVADRPEMTALKKAAEATDAEVTEAKSFYYPELYAHLGLDYVRNSQVQEQAIYSATVGLRVNLFEGYATVARQRQAVQNRSRAEERLRLQEAKIRLELQVAQNDARVAAERIRTMEQSIRQGEENLRINRDRYSEQVGTATEVLDAQTLLTQVKTDYFRARYAFEVAQARIRHALGKL